MRVGRATKRKLNDEGVYTAAELRDMPLKKARAIGTVVSLNCEASRA